jgi:hypothetical protein
MAASGGFGEIRNSLVGNLCPTFSSSGAEQFLGIKAATEALRDQVVRQYLRFIVACLEQGRIFRAPVDEPLNAVTATEVAANSMESICAISSTS